MIKEKLTNFGNYLKQGWANLKSDPKSWLKRQALKIGVAIGIIGIAMAASLPKDEISRAKFIEKYNASQEIKAVYQLSGASLKRADIKNTELTNKGELKDVVRVQIGNKDDTEFTPDLTISRWDEVSFKIKPNLEGIPTRDKDLTFEGDKIKFGTPKIDFEMYSYEEGEGGYKFVWTLNEKPATNKVEFQIESEGLDFFYQPPLTQQEIDEGAFRPENVVGSYAVYHSTKDVMNDINGKDYKVGKVGHIYRPKLIDSNGWEVWGDLNIKNGIYSVEIPQDFLDKAVYPIKSNDTFGYENKGGTVGDTYQNNFGSGYVYIRGYHGSPVDDGTVDNVKAWLVFQDCASGDTFQGKAALYDHSDDSLLDSGESDELEFSYSPNDDVEKTFTFTSGPSILSSDEYWITVWGWDKNGTFNADIRPRYDSDSETGFYDSENPYDGTFPDPLNPTLADRKYSIYATYTPSAPAAAPIIEGQIWEIE